MLAVIAFHAGLPVPGGFIGVDVFFVISGYVITAMLLRELDAYGRIRFGRFYLRRFKRLTPALALTVAVTCAASAFVLSPLGPQQTAGRTAVGAMFLAANWAIAHTTGAYFDAPAATNPLLNIWSLSVEEQFYLGFPLLMVLAWTLAARTGRPSHVKAAVAATGLLSFILAVVGSTTSSTNFALGFYSPFTRAWEFAAGALLALVPQPRWSRQGGIVVSSLGAGLLLFALWEIDGTKPFPGWWTLLPVLATVALISGAARRGNAMAALLASRSMVRMGDWSYSLYLWHWPAIVLAGVLLPTTPHIGLVAALASVVPALASYHLLEQPVRSRDFAPRAFTVLVLATLAVPLATAFGLTYAADHIWKPRITQAAPSGADARAMHAGYVEGCHFEPGDGSTDPQPCVWNAEQSGRPVYLLGDSNAAQFEEALIDATAALHEPLTASTSSGCPLLDIRMDGPEFRNYGAACRARNERLLRWMATVTPGTVVLASSDDYWFDPGWSVVENGQRLTDRGAMIDAMQASLTRVVHRLQARGHRVLLVHTIPHWVRTHAWDPSSCSLAASLTGCVQVMPAADAVGETAAVHAVIDAVGRSTDSGVIDVTPQVCPDGTCRTATASMHVYRDATHITVAMSHTLAPVFERALGITS